MITLEKLKPGQCGVISHIMENGSEESDLMEMGLIAGTPVRLVKFAPLGDPLEVRVRGYNLSIRRAEARSIFIETPNGTARANGKTRK